MRKILPLMFAILLSGCGGTPSLNDLTNGDETSEGISDKTPMLPIGIEEDKVHFHGRYLMENEAIAFFQSASGISLDVEAEDNASIAFSLRGATNGYDEQYVDLLIDGAVARKERLESGSIIKHCEWFNDNCSNIHPYMSVR